MKKQPIPGSLRLWQLVVFLIAPVLCALARAAQKALRSVF